MPKYSKPRIKEVLCEFAFKSDQWDLTIPGILYEKFWRQKYPLKEQQADFSVQFKTVKGRLEQVIEQGPRVLFKNSESTMVIQLSFNQLVINGLKEYPGWESFKKSVLDILRDYITIASPQKVSSMGLRYINAFEFINKQSELWEYFNFYPKIPEDFGTMVTDLISGVVIEDQKYAQKGTVTMKSLKIKDEYLIVLDILASNVKETPPDIDEVSNKLEIMHQWIENIFENSITDKLREKLKPEE